MSLAALLNATTLKKGASTITTESLAGKTVLLYFSASWCPPCRGFTPHLVEFYKKHAESKNFEVIFVPWDEEEEDYEGYYAKMPWATLPFSAPVVPTLNDKFAVESIPTVIGLDGTTLEVITRAARNKVLQDPEAANFPWKE